MSHIVEESIRLLRRSLSRVPDTDQRQHLYAVVAKAETMPPLDRAEAVRSAVAQLAASPLFEASGDAELAAMAKASSDGLIERLDVEIDRLRDECMRDHGNAD